MAYFCNQLITIVNSYRLYSIGHSNQSQEEFLQLLKHHDINCIVDVRSMPASKFAPQFNQENLKWFLRKNGVQYLYFGEEFGARRTDCLDKDGQVDFELVATSLVFLIGVKRLMSGLEKGFHIALMCSEADPLECHRFALISRYFHEHGVEVQHVLKDGELASQIMLEKQMIEEYLKSRKYHLSEVDQLFGTYTAEEQLRDAYRLKNKEIGYKQQMETEEALTI